MTRLHWVKNNEAYYAYQNKNSYFENQENNIYTICGNVIYFINNEQAEQIGLNLKLDCLLERKDFCKKHFQEIIIKKRKEHKMTNENNKLQDLIITKDDLKQLKVLDKPIDTATRLVWIFRTVAYEYGRGKKGCYIPLNEICITGYDTPVRFMDEVITSLRKTGYYANLTYREQGLGDCLEIVWG